MYIKEFLDSIGIFTENEDEAYSLLNDKEVRDLLTEKWNEKIFRPDVRPGQVRLEEAETTKDPTIIDNTEEMGIFKNAGQSDFREERNKDEVFEIHVREAYIVLKNGKVSQPYSSELDLSVLRNLEIGVFWLEGLENLGLNYNKDKNIISGLPEVAGEHKISFFYKHKDWRESDPAMVRNINLVINPDPRSLWNNIPTPKDTLFYKPDSDKKFLEVVSKSGFLGLAKEKGKNMVAASQRGRSHAHDGKPRDDDFGLFFNEPEWYIMAVADGAGSAKYSRKGSQIACEAAIDTCDSYLTEFDHLFAGLISDYYKNRSEENKKRVLDIVYKVLGAAVFKAYKNIELKALEMQSQIKDFSTTLIVSVCKKFKFGWFIASFWVGDGGIGIYDKQRRYLKIMGDTDGGEFAGQTRFLTMPEIMQPEEIYKRLRFEIVEDFTAVVLMTDGITDPKFETDANLKNIEKWDELWDSLSPKVEFYENNIPLDSRLLEWLDFWSPGNHDDRTIAILF